MRYARVSLVAVLAVLPVVGMAAGEAEPKSDGIIAGVVLDQHDKPVSGAWVIVSDEAT